MRRSIVLGAFVLAGSLTVVRPAPAAAIIRYVAANGADTATCGTLTAPCRSISKAIERAVSGDQIMVGPGRYGDVDRDGRFVTPGDEGPAGAVLVNKAVTVQSSGGAAVTVIEYAPTVGTAVYINAAGAVFGLRDKGFTVRSSAKGIEIAANDVSVQENRILAREIGVKIRQSLGTNATITGNVISNAMYGVDVETSGASITGNVLESNGIAIGIAPDATNTLIDGNVIVNSIGNAGGIVVDAANTIITHNLLAGNVNTAISRIADGAITVASNNFLGNAVGASNCALMNDRSESMRAESNYWGSAQGPGVDPADRACGSGPVDTAPFLTRAVVITNTAGK